MEPQPPREPATSTLTGGATLAARWLYGPQPVRNQPVWLGFHTVWGGIDPGDARFRPQVLGVSSR